MQATASPISATSTAVTSTEQPKTFGVLDPYARVFVGRNADDITEFIDLLKTTYEIKDELKIKDVTLEDDTYKREFKCIDAPGLGRVFLILLYNPGVGTKNARDVFEIAAYLKKSLIVWVHYRAIICCKPNLYHNFPTILFHSLEEMKAYVGGKILSDDQKEILYSLKQKQTYVKEEVKHREDFAAHKEERAEAIEQKRQERRQAKQEENPQGEEQEEQQAPVQREHKPHKNHTNNNGGGRGQGNQHSEGKKNYREAAYKGQSRKDDRGEEQKERRADKPRHEKAKREPQQSSAPGRAARPLNGRQARHVASTTRNAPFTLPPDDDTFIPVQYDDEPIQAPAPVQPVFNPFQANQFQAAPQVQMSQADMAQAMFMYQQMQAFQQMQAQQPRK